MKKLQPPQRGGIRIAHIVGSAKASSANAGTVNAVLSPRFGRRGLFMVQLTRVFTFIKIVRF